MTTWNPDRYLRFAEERALPFRHLVAAVSQLEPRTIADLGCGPGGLTATLLDRWPKTRIVGVDNSREMIDRARKRQVGDRLTFERADITTWVSEEPLDLILANAAFHWVADQTALLRHLRQQLAKEGTIAFQVPNNFDQPSHEIPRQVAAEMGESEALKSLEAAHVEKSERYRDLLESLGLAVTAWETIYFHRLSGDNPVLEWLSGTTLRPVLGQLEARSREVFVGECAKRLREAYPPQATATIYPFKRLFVVAS